MTEQAKQELAACLELRAYWRSEAIKARTERDAALASIAELEKSHRIIERLYKIERYKIERQERIEAEARIAEAAKLHRRDSPGLGGEWCQSDGLKWPCPTAVSLGLNEGENEK